MWKRIDLTREDVVRIATSIAEEYKVEIIFGHPDCERNHAAYGFNIMMGEFDDKECMLVAFFHELGHMLFYKMHPNTHNLCIVSNEGAAWELGLSIALSKGYKWDYDSKAMQWAREQLKTYAQNEDNFK